MAKVRSPNYPTADLSTALELIRPAFKAENRNKMSRAVLAKHMGHKTLNGQALTKLSAMRAYGLIEGSSDELRLSDDAVFVLASPDKVNVNYRDALDRLALKPQLFQDIKKQFPTTLPSEHNLSFWLVQQHFTEEAAGKAAKSFLATMRLVSGGTGDYNPSSGEEEPMTTQPPAMEIKPRMPSTSPSKAGLLQEVFNLEEGPVTLMFPATLSSESYQDLADHLAIFLRKAKRRSEAAN
jgi:hypothetical protein